MPVKPGMMLAAYKVPYYMQRFIKVETPDVTVTITGEVHNLNLAVRDINAAKFSMLLNDDKEIQPDFISFDKEYNQNESLVMRVIFYNNNANYVRRLVDWSAPPDIDKYVDKNATPVVYLMTCLKYTKNKWCVFAILASLSSSFLLGLPLESTVDYPKRLDHLHGDQLINFLLYLSIDLKSAKNMKKFEGLNPIAKSVLKEKIEETLNQFELCPEDELIIKKFQAYEMIKKLKQQLLAVSEKLASESKLSDNVLDVSEKRSWCRLFAMTVLPITVATVAVVSKCIYS